MTTDCTFSQLYLHDNSDGAGISLDGNFAHNVIDTAVLSGNDLGIFMRWSHDNQFRNISIQDSHNYGVFMADNLGESSVGQANTYCFNNSFTNISANKPIRVNDKSPAPTTWCNSPAKSMPQLSMVVPGLLLVK